MSFRRDPVVVWLNRSAFPLDLISFTPRNQTLTDVEVDFGYANSALKVRSGDGDRWNEIRPGEYIDLLVQDGQPSQHEFPALDRARVLPLLQNQPLVITVSWAQGAGDALRGSMCVIWTHSERAKGRSPRLYFHEEAEAVKAYAFDQGQGITGASLLPSRRVRSMRRGDVKARIAGEKQADNEHSSEAALIRTSNLAVAGFRGFRERADLRLALPSGRDGSGLTIVVGANNTGKSTLWESFDAVARKQKSDVSFSEGRRNRQTPEGIEIVLTRSDGSSFRLASQNKSTSETTGIWSGTSSSSEFEVVTVPSRRQFEASFSKQVNPQRDWMIGSQEFGRQRRPDNAFTGRLFDLHSDVAKKAEFDKLMSEVVGHPLEWSIDLADGQYGQSYYLKVSSSDDVTHTSEGLGDGIVSLLFILNALYDSRPDTLLVLDEPELSLHPQLVKRLRAVLSRFAATRQIVLFTHSPLLVSWDDVAAGAEVARVFKLGADSRLAQVPRDALNQLSKARGGWRNPHILGTDATAALFLDRDEIVVVEGQEDVGLLPRVYEQANVPMRGEMFGWGAGGGDGGPRRILALLDGLGFEKVVALLDADKQREVGEIQRQFPHYLALTIPADDIRDKSASHFPGKSGLLDVEGKVIKPELVQGTREVLKRLADYFDTSVDEAPATSTEMHAKCGDQ